MAHWVPPGPGCPSHPLHSATASRGRRNVPCPLLTHGWQGMEKDTEGNSSAKFLIPANWEPGDAQHPWPINMFTVVLIPANQPGDAQEHILQMEFLVDDFKKESWPLNWKNISNKRQLTDEQVQTTECTPLAIWSPNAAARAQMEGGLLCHFVITHLQQMSYFQERSDSRATLSNSFDHRSK